jgi:Uncharacterized protein predicted to be involved in DNA repair
MMVSTLYQARPPEPPAHIADDACPLYIAAGSDTRVRLDRRALSVQREARAEQLFPLQRIARVHSSTLVQWSTEALLACAERGISVVFVHDDATSPPACYRAPAPATSCSTACRILCCCRTGSIAIPIGSA